METLGNTISLFTEAGILIKSKMRRALPLSFSQCQTLSFVKESGHPNMQEVAHHFKIKAPSATSLVEDLVQSGLITRRASIGDRRKIELELTLKGRNHFKILTKKRTKVLNDIFRVLSPNDRADLNRILKKILAAA